MQTVNIGNQPSNIRIAYDSNLAGKVFYIVTLAVVKSWWTVIAKSIL